MARRVSYASLLMRHALTLFALVCLIGPANAAVTVPQGGTPSGSLAGTWTLDPYVSDHPEQVARALRVDTSEANEDVARGPSGREGDSSRGGGGRSGTTRKLARESLSAADRKLLSDMTDTIRFAPTTLTIAQTDTTVSITTGANTPPDTLHTDGKAEKYRLPSGTVERTARWEGPEQLVVEYDVGQSFGLTYTYHVAPTTGQLVIRIAVERRRGEPGPFEIKLVYNPGSRPASAQ